MTPNGQAATQYVQPLQISFWIRMFSNSVCTIAPVGHAWWQGAVTQCLQTSLIISQRLSFGSRERPSQVKGPSAETGAAGTGCGCNSSIGNCSMNFTCRHDVADSSSVLS